MTAYITHDANLARLDAMQSLADADREVKRAIRQLEQMVEPAPPRSGPRPAPPSVIRNRFLGLLSDHH